MPLSSKWIKTAKFSCVCLFFIFVTYVVKSNYEEIFGTFKFSSETIKLSYNLIKLEELSELNRSIMFIEGHFNDYLPNRMLCSIESAALAHNDTPIVIIMTSKTLKNTSNVKALIENYRNIFFLYLNTTKLYMKSPLRNWFRQETWKKSKWPKTNFSDPLRFLLLWYYGGIYLDMDVLVLRNFLLESNFIGLQSKKFANTAILGFSPRHSFIWDTLEEVAKNFKGNVWGFNGPHLITRMLIKRCGADFHETHNNTCLGIRILEEKVFYSIPWRSSKNLFVKNMTLVRDIMKDSHILAIHLWNFLTHDTKLMLDYPSFYSILAKQFCPLTVFTTTNNIL